MKEYTCTSLSEIQQRIEKIRQTHQQKHKVSPALLFRGQADADWPLMSTLERANPGRNWTLDSYLKRALYAYSKICSHFPRHFAPKPLNHEEIDAACNEISRVKEGEVLGGSSCFGHMALLRHLGFPSPLIDWTASLYVATYFALRGADSMSDGFAAVIALDPGLHGTTQHATCIRRVGPYLLTHDRHFRQQSEYTYCSQYKTIDDEGKHLIWLMPHEAGLGSPKAYSWKIRIPSSHRTTILKELKELNINDFTLMGSPDSLAFTLGLEEISFLG